MARKTIYCAQAFWLRRGQLIGGEVYRFLNEERARRGAEALFTGNQGVAVFSLDGYPDTDVWEDPVMIETRGFTPVVEAQNCQVTGGVVDGPSYSGVPLAAAKTRRSI